MSPSYLAVFANCMRFCGNYVHLYMNEYLELIIYSRKNTHNYVKCYVTIDLGPNQSGRY